MVNAKGWSGELGKWVCKESICSSNNPSAMSRSPISHYIESRVSTEGNRGSRIEGAFGEARVDELRAMDSWLS